jgi:hypothetical protein
MLYKEKINGKNLESYNTDEKNESTSLHLRITALLGFPVSYESL